MTSNEDVQRFSTGAVRGTDAMDERYDLLSLVALRKVAQWTRFSEPWNREDGLPVVAQEATGLTIGSTLAACWATTTDGFLGSLAEAAFWGLLASHLDRGGSYGACEVFVPEEAAIALLPPLGVTAYSNAMAEGVVKYPVRNWLLGMPLHDVLNHAIRHQFLWLSGDRTEDHLGHACWNLMTAVHFAAERPELGDGMLWREADLEIARLRAGEAAEAAEGLFSLSDEDPAEIPESEIRSIPDSVFGGGGQLTTQESTRVAETSLRAIVGDDRIVERMMSHLDDGAAMRSAVGTELDIDSQARAAVAASEAFVATLAAEPEMPDALKIDTLARVFPMNVHRGPGGVSYRSFPAGPVLQSWLHVPKSWVVVDGLLCEPGLPELLATRRFLARLDPQQVGTLPDGRRWVSRAIVTLGHQPPPHWVLDEENRRWTEPDGVPADSPAPGWFSLIHERDRGRTPDGRLKVRHGAIDRLEMDCRLSVPQADGARDVLWKWELDADYAWHVEPKATAEAEAKPDLAEELRRLGVPAWVAEIPEADRGWTDDLRVKIRRGSVDALEARLREGEQAVEADRVVHDFLDGYRWRDEKGWWVFRGDDAGKDRP